MSCNNFKIELTFQRKLAHQRYTWLGPGILLTCTNLMTNNVKRCCAFSLEIRKVEGGVEMDGNWKESGWSARKEACWLGWYEL